MLPTQVLGPRCVRYLFDSSLIKQDSRTYTYSIFERLYAVGQLNRVKHVKCRRYVQSLEQGTMDGCGHN